MRCPSCGEDRNFVRRTHDNFMQDAITRRRFCAECGHEFETQEKPIKLQSKDLSKGYGKKKA